jgi:hypothetical protein
MVDIAMNSIVLHRFAKERARSPGLLGVILIKAIGIRRVTCINMQRIAGAKKMLVEHWKRRGNLALMRSKKNLANAKLIDGTITASFERQGKGAIFDMPTHLYGIKVS